MNIIINKMNTDTQQLIQCIVENGYNTSYISSFLFSLFYRPNKYLDELLTKNIDNPSAYYLQELIKENFVEPIRKHFSISNDSINEIRNYLMINNWATTDSKLNQQQDIAKFYKFIIDYLKGYYIEFEIYNIQDGHIKNIDNNFKVPFIVIKPLETTSIKKLFIKWLNDYIIKETNSYYYKLNNIPSYICFYINRFGNSNQIDIMKKIKFFNNNDSTQKYITWKIQGIICVSGDKLENCHYYSVVHSYNNWVLFDDTKIPSLQYIDMGDEDIIEKIKKECTLIVYSLKD